MKKLILLTALATSLFADVCLWNINMTTEEINKAVISIKDNDALGVRYHLDMALIYNMDSLIKCDAMYKDRLNQTRQTLLKKKEEWK